MKFICSILFMALGILPSTVIAQEAEASTKSMWNTDPLMGSVLVLVALVMVLVLITMVVMINLAKLMLTEAEKAKAQAEGREYVEPIGILEGIWLKMKRTFITGKLYSEKEERESMMLDHNYDGIQEMDYGMPPWLTYFFLITVGFGVIYMLNIYAFGIIPSQENEYIAEVAMAEAAIEEWRAGQANLVDENSVEFSEEKAHLDAGMAIFMKDCKVCHGEFGQGGVGPNFTDEYWIHGGGIKDIFKTIKYGVPEKGMISWQNQLTPADMSAVASYIYIMQGTTPPAADSKGVPVVLKEPQGEIFAREGEAETATPEESMEVEAAAPEEVTETEETTEAEEEV